MTGPLDGLRVVDLTQGYVGHCGMMFSDMGATVIKVEPPEGDYLRRLGPPFVGEDAAAFPRRQSRQAERAPRVDGGCARPRKKGARTR